MTRQRFQRFQHNYVRIEAAKQAAEETGCIILKENEGHPYDFVVLYAPSKRTLDKYLYRYVILTKGLDLKQEVRTLVPWDLKGWVFYAEYVDRTHKNRDVAHSPRSGREVLQHTNGNVIAVFPEQRGYDGTTVAAISTIMSEPVPNDTRLSFSEVSFGYLTENGKRISLEQALRLHPNLFLSTYFDEEGK